MSESASDQEKQTPSIHVESKNIDQGLTASAAQLASVVEHNQTLWQALKAEPRAVFWSVAVSTAIIMEGYDIVLVTSLFAQPAFAEQYGSYDPGSKSWQIPAPWQSATGIAPMIGAILGAFLNGWLTHKFGYRKVLLASLVAITAFILVLFFAKDLGTIFAALVLCGIPWGVFATMAPAYASEVCSLKLRGYLTVYVNLCWAFGQLIAAGVLEGFASSTSQWAYRIPFALQWIFPIPLFLVVWFCPESPWWLVRKGRLQDAKAAITRLSSSASTNPNDTISLILHTNLIEDETQSGSSYWSCFKGVDLRRTEIACVVWAAQVWCGSPLGGTPAYFFTQAGLSSSDAFALSVGGLGLASIGTIISWFLISRLGRRTLYVWGLGLLCACLLIVGIVAAAMPTTTESSFIQAGFVVAWLLVYYLTVGPVCYAIIAEVSAVRLRNKSVCLSRISYYISQVIGNVIEPYMINPGNADWHGKTAFFWAGTCLLFFVWAFMRLPETKNRSYEELDILFNQRVQARDFSKTTVDPYAAVGERVKCG